VFFGSVALMVILNRLAPTPVLVPEGAGRIGWAVVAAGVVLGGLGAGLFHRRGAEIKPFRESAFLVTDGPFRFTRNPMYLSMVMVLLGTAGVLGSLLPFVVIPLFVLVLRRRFIRWEEAALAARFGDEYRAYCARVRRWI
jgi:protein-S-isoprenylcysteine O-methyltransferase Ste14